MQDENFPHIKLNLKKVEPIFIDKENINKENISDYEKMVERYLYKGRKYHVVLTKTTTPGIEIWRKVVQDGSSVWDLWAALYYSNETKNWRYRQYDPTPMSKRLDNPLDANQYMKKQLLTTEMIEILEAYTVAARLNRRGGNGHENTINVQGIIFQPPIFKNALQDIAKSTIHFKCKL